MGEWENLMPTVVVGRGLNGADITNPMLRTR